MNKTTKNKKLLEHLTAISNKSTAILYQTGCVFWFDTIYIGVNRYGESKGQERTIKGKIIKEDNIWFTD